MQTNYCVPPAIVIKSVTGNAICVNNGCLTTPNPIAKRMYQIIPRIYEFYATVFKLCGIDGTGKLPHFEINWTENNAAYVCGEPGTPCKWKFNNSLAVKPEIIAHEYAHAIFSNRLRYANQSGALEESKADVLAIAFKQWDTKSPNDWKIGSLRDISQHRTMRDFKYGSNDNGFVHENSQIPSRAFHYAVMATQTRADGIISQIWIRAYQRVSFDEKFSNFALKTISIAQTTIPSTANAVILGWLDVEVISWVPQKSLQMIPRECY